MFCSLYGITRMYDVLEKCATFLDHPVYFNIIQPALNRIHFARIFQYHQTSKVYSIAIWKQ